MSTFVILLLTFSESSAQQHYSKNIDIDGQSDTGGSIRETEDGLVFTGLSACFDTLIQCFSILTADGMGNVTNFKQYSNSPLNMSIGAAFGNIGIVLKNPDEYYFSGAIQMNTPQWDYFLMKTTNEGDSVWMKSYGHPGKKDLTSQMIMDTDSSLIMLTAYEIVPHKYLVGLQKVDLYGKVIWEKYLGEDFTTVFFQDLIKLSNGDLLVSYVSSETTLPYEPYSMTVTKLDAQGNEKWTHSYASFEGDIGGVHSCLLELDNGEYLVNYIRFEFGPSLEPPIFLWLDSLGNVTKQYDFPNDRERDINDLIKTADGRIVGVGQVDLIDYEMGYTGWVFAFTQSGEPLWERFVVDPQLFLPHKFAELVGVEEIGDGRLAAIGTIYVPNDYDVWLLMADSVGCTVPGCTGVFQGFSATETQAPPSDALSIWPNPVTGVLLHLGGPAELLQAPDALLRIFDMTGRLVLEQASSPQVNIAGLPQGVFVLSLISTDGSAYGVGRFVRG